MREPERKVFMVSRNDWPGCLTRDSIWMIPFVCMASIYAGPHHTAAPYHDTGIR
jgi:hypothetical protein